VVDLKVTDLEEEVDSEREVVAHGERIFINYKIPYNWKQLKLE